jgi:hypothetical protein
VRRERVGRRRELKTHDRASVLIFTILLALIILGGYAATSQAAIVKVKVWYLPWWVNLAEPPKWGIYAIIDPPSGYRPRDVNPDKILLENMLVPVDTTSSWFWFIAEFDSHAVIDIIWAKTYHMGLPSGKHTIDLTITGEFKDGTPFEGIGKMVVKIPESPPKL